MNPLTDPLPTTVEVAGEQVPINTSHRVGIAFQDIVERHIPDSQKVALALHLYYDPIPTDIRGAVDSLLAFYRCGKPDKETSSVKVYDYAHDYDSIYASFMRAYGIDLLDPDTNLHWWRFMAMLTGLPEDSPFIKAVSARSVKLGEIKDKHQREYYAKLKRLHALPSRSEEAMSLDEIHAAKFAVVD